MILALAGLAGAGKTTAIRMLSDAGCGSRLYVGGIVMEEVRRRGMTSGSESERLVRNVLREAGGMGVLARIASSAIERMDARGGVLIDAVYNPEEHAIYTERFGYRFKVLGIRTPTGIRAARLSMRSQRPITADELAKRDEYELGTLRLDHVLAQADHGIDNAGSLDELEHSLQAVLTALG